MKPQTISKLIAALLLGILMGSAVHYDHVRLGQISRQDFLEKQSVRFDKFYAQPPSIVIEIVVGVIVAGFGFGAYELVAFGISKCFRKTNDEAAGS